MKPAVPADALARVAQARAAADRSLAAWHAQRVAWHAAIQRVPPWAVVLSGFVAGALAGRILGRTRPQRATVRLFTVLAPWARLALEALVPREAPRGAAPAPEPARPGAPAVAARDD